MPERVEPGAAHVHGQRHVHRRHRRLHDERRLVPHGLAGRDAPRRARARRVRRQALERHAELRRVGQTARPGSASSTSARSRPAACCSTSRGCTASTTSTTTTRSPATTSSARPRRPASTVEPGDAVLVRTGQMHFLRAGDKRRYSMPSPGPVDEVDRMDPRPRRRARRDRHDHVRGATRARTRHVFMPVHMIQLRDMGLAQGQNWHLDDLAADCAADGAVRLPARRDAAPAHRRGRRARRPRRDQVAGAPCSTRRGRLHLDDRRSTCARARSRRVTTARATSSGCIVLKWRWIPKRCQRGMISANMLEVPVVGEPGDRRPDPHDRRADRDVLALERERRARTPRARPSTTP